LDGIEGSVESSNFSAIVYVVRKLGHASFMMLGDKLVRKINETTRFLAEFRQITFYGHVLKVYINFQRKKKLPYRHYPFKIEASDKLKH
jgi:hypothetical protein